MALASLLPVFLAVLALLGLALLAMAVGVIFRRPCLRGSCGGVGAHAGSSAGDPAGGGGCGGCRNKHHDAAGR